MSNSESYIQHTQHAFLVAWGWFAQHLGLIEKLQAVSLQQKHYHHRPQTKVLEFLVAILSGLEHLQEISLAAHPLDKDQAVAHAWHQPGWADYSGVSRTLSRLSWDEVKQIIQVLEQISHPYLSAEVQLLCVQGNRLCLDGDLTGIAVSNTSQSYPHAAFGHMDDEIRLGYQAGVVSLQSPTYGRLWLSATHHPGDTVSCTQAEVLVLAAEARLHLRPRRRTELLAQRIAAVQQVLSQTQQRLQKQQQALKQAQARLAEAKQSVGPGSQASASEPNVGSTRRQRSCASNKPNSPSCSSVCLGLNWTMPPTPKRLKPRCAWMLASAPMRMWPCSSRWATTSTPNPTATKS